MDRVRLGLIGAGGMANTVHYPSLEKMDDVSLAALCDVNPDRLVETADRFGIEQRYTDAAEMMDKESLDAIYVLMPPHQLFDLVMDVLERGLHLFIEKPPGITAAQTRQMSLAVEEAGIVSMVGFNRRYTPLIAQSKETVIKNGPMLQCVSKFYKPMAGKPHPYYRGAIDVLRCDAIHAVDMLRYMGGDVLDVASDVQAYKSTYDNMFNALIQFESGGVGVLLTNWNVGGRRHEFEMHAEGVSAFVNPDEEARIWQEDSADPTIVDTKQAADSDEFRVFYGFEGENRHFIDCVKAGKQPQSNFADAAKSMELAEMIYAAAM
jgi:virulence factor